MNYGSVLFSMVKFEITNRKKQISNKKQTQKNNFQTSGKTDFFRIIFFVCNFDSFR